MADVTVAPLPRAYRWRDENNQVFDFGQGDTKIPEAMALSLHKQGLIPAYAGMQPKQKQGEVTPPAATLLPEDFPGRKQFVDAGYNTLEAVQGLESLEGIAGVGPATITKVGEYFSATS